MSNPVNSLDNVLQAMALMTASQTTLGSGGILSVNGYYQGDMAIWLGRTHAAAGAPFTYPVTIGLDGFFDVANDTDTVQAIGGPFTSALGSALVYPALGSSIAAGVQVIPVSVTTGFVVGGFVLIEDLNTPSQSEVVKVESIQSGVSITCVRPTRYLHNTTGSGCYVTSGAEEFNSTIDLEEFQGIQLNIDSDLNSVAFYCRAVIDLWKSQ